MESQAYLHDGIAEVVCLLQRAEGAAPREREAVLGDLRCAVIDLELLVCACADADGALLDDADGVVAAALALCGEAPQQREEAPREPELAA